MQGTGARALYRVLYSDHPLNRKTDRQTDTTENINVIPTSSQCEPYVTVIGSISRKNLQALEDGHLAMVFYG